MTPSCQCVLIECCVTQFLSFIHFELLQCFEIPSVQVPPSLFMPRKLFYGINEIAVKVPSIFKLLIKEVRLGVAPAGADGSDAADRKPFSLGPGGAARCVGKGGGRSLPRGASSSISLE